MFDFSLGKLFLLALIALIVLGPEKLPRAARTVGALIRRVRTGWDSVRDDLERELEIEEIRKNARKAAAEAEAAQDEAKATLQRMRAQAGQVRDEVVNGDNASDNASGRTTESGAATDEPEADSTDTANHNDRSDEAGHDGT